MEKELLKDSFYFSELSDEELEEIKKIMITRKYKEGEIIFFEGEMGKSLHLVEAGKIKLVKMIESGEEQILNVLKKGSIFAEVVLFDKANYPATAIALEDSEIGVIKRGDMENLITEFPKMALKILRVMSKRLRRAQKMVQDLGLRNTTSRTASILVYLAREHGVKAGEQVEINLSLTQQEMADRIGSSRETISRILSKFKEQKLIAVSRQKVVIKDLTALQDLI